jgi:hypothetical protein
MNNMLMMLLLHFFLSSSSGFLVVVADVDGFFDRLVAIHFLHNNMEHVEIYLMMLK